PAAFRRLCVETACRQVWGRLCRPAAFRRLCVETAKADGLEAGWLPAAFRRLCVETFWKNLEKPIETASRLQAAVC
ncbi:hypothetical protein, partial [Neisseria sp. HMSC065D04]|uniref:hypothetical protein n=1 Tax=Neisseria sp. HMSC065D04 TaxID=1739542 RepID=UPI001AEFE243